MDLESLLNEPNPFQLTNEDSCVSVSKHKYCSKSSKRRGKDGIKSQWVKTFLEELKQSTPSNITHEKNSKKSNGIRNIIDSVETYISKVNSEQKEKMPLREFIAQKRQLLLLNRSLNLKREEIQKLDAKLKTKREALEQSAQVLEEDALRFDSYLRENNKKAEIAIRMAERETKKKVEKMQEIKLLNEELQKIQSNIHKHTRNLDEYVKYGAFLDTLVPEEWFQMQNEIKRNRRNERRRKRIEIRKTSWIQEQMVKKEEWEKSQQHTIRLKAREEKRERKKAHRNDKFQGTDITPEYVSPTMPDFEDEPLTSDSEEESPMYFTSPQQLFDKFAALEDDNLFLIQNVQEAEQSLEEMTVRLNESMADAANKMNKMRSYIHDIKSDMNERQSEIEAIQTHVERGGEKSELEDQSGRTGCQKAMNKELVEKVKEIYLSCGYTLVGGANPSLLFMLSQIECGVDSTLERLKAIPNDKLHAAIKLKEKARRKKRLLHQQQEQKKNQEERNRKVLERSLQPPKKPVGKKVMYRSYVTHQVDNHHVTVNLTEEEILEQKFLSLEM